MLLIPLKSLTSRLAKQHDLWQIPAVHPTVYMTLHHSSASRRKVTYSAPSPPQLQQILIHAASHRHIFSWYVTLTNHLPSHSSTTLFDFFVLTGKRRFPIFTQGVCGIVLISLSSLLCARNYILKSLFCLETMQASVERAVEPAEGDGDCNWHYASLTT